MIRPFPRVLPLAGVFALALAAAAFAQEASPGIALSKVIKAGSKNVHPLSATACSTSGITCGGSVNGTLDSQDCQLGDETRADNYTFQGTAGQTVTIAMSSSALDAYLILRNPAGTAVALDDDSGGGPDGTNAQIIYTLPTTGVWTIVANAVYIADRGPYFLSLSCGAVTACVPNATSMCLNSRFRVSANWQTTTASGAGTPIQLTSDTGYFWFFSSSNVEIVVKVLNGCGLNSRYWTFAGGLTNVLVNLTVTDTQTGAVRTYSNPQNQAFLPIQDTSSFSTCP
ncbi:MAG: PPC domain-containing protein [Acidobacteriota bacterium]